MTIKLACPNKKCNNGKIESAITNPKTNMPIIKNCPTCKGKTYTR